MAIVALGTAGRLGRLAGHPCLESLLVLGAFHEIHLVVQLPPALALAVLSLESQSYRYPDIDSLLWEHQLCGRWLGPDFLRATNRWVFDCLVDVRYLMQWPMEDLAESRS